MKVTVNIDDFCDNEWSLMDEFFALRKRYPKFKITLFTISFRISPEHLIAMKQTGWIETAVHGFNHGPNKDMLGEMIAMKKEDVIDGFSRLDFSKFVRGFRAPYWLMTEETIKCCNQFGMWLAIHPTKNPESWRSLAKHGYYYPEHANGNECWYGHTYDIKRELPGLLKKWPEDQEFAFVSEAIRFDPEVAQRMVKLNFGAGINPVKGFINIDCNPDLPAHFPDYDMRELDIRNGLGMFGDGSIDAATESHVLMYLRVEEYQKFFADVYRVLKSGGIFRVTEEDYENPDNGIRDYALSVVGPRMMREELEKAGFEVHDILEWGETFWIDNSLMQNLHGGQPKIFWMEAVKKW